MTKVLPARDRYDWIMDYLRAMPGKRGPVDILDAEFVDAYAEATGATLQYTPYGANRCRLLGTDLKAMFDARMLKRNLVPLPYDMRGLGFPLFVYHYELHPVWL